MQVRAAPVGTFVRLRTKIKGQFRGSSEGGRRGSADLPFWEKGWGRLRERCFM